LHLKGSGWGMTESGLSHGGGCQAPSIRHQLAVTGAQPLSEKGERIGHPALKTPLRGWDVIGHF